MLLSFCKVFCKLQGCRIKFLKCVETNLCGIYSFCLYLLLEWRPVTIGKCFVLSREVRLPASADYVRRESGRTVIDVAR